MYGNLIPEPNKEDSIEYSREKQSENIMLCFTI